MTVLVFVLCLAFVFLVMSVIELAGSVSDLRDELNHARSLVEGVTAERDRLAGMMARVQKALLP